jgi:putative membrane protein
MTHNQGMSDLNDPRVFFAAERTLLAWQRTGLVLMAFGFMIERAELLMSALGQTSVWPQNLGLWLGLTFIALGVASIVTAVQQFRRVLATLRPIEIPSGYRTGLSLILNLGVALAGLLLGVSVFLMRW